MKTILLSGQWTLSGQDQHGNKITLPITIPGYVHPVLEQAGLIPPMYWRQNAQDCQWIEKVTWTFSRAFEVSEDTDLSRAEICFGGIDTYADIYLNGTHLAASRNMFVPLVCQAASAIRHGHNDLTVVIHPYAEMIQGKDMNHGAAFTRDRVHVRRVQCTFWWDWVDRFISAGLWKDVTLRFPSASVIDHVYAYTQAIDPTSASLIIKLKTINARNANCRFVVDITDPDGHNAWHTTGRVYLDEIALQADLPNARLWWPNGYGDHPLYTVSVHLLSDNGDELDCRAFKTGIRTVRLEYLRDKTGSPEEQRTQHMRELYKINDNTLTGESCILLVNGVRIFCKGGNFVPPTPFPGTIPPAHYENLIKLAAEGGMTLLRVWGGGEYEPDCFYDYCDQYGIMLLHDFMLSCGDYPEEDPDFVENFRQEIHANVIALRNHCCIAFWSGNNENCDHFDWDDPHMKDIGLLTDAYLPELTMLDPARPFRPGSPWGGYRNADATIGDCHDSWWWRGAEKITPQFFSCVPRFSSENPCEGYPLPSVLKQFLSQDDLDHPDDSEALEYHIKNNHYFTDMGWPSVHERLKINTRTLLGDSDSAAQTLFLRAYIQYEWSRLAIEGMRRSKWYASAIQFWMFNDCWPALGYATIDFYGRPKAGWYSCRRAYAPTAAALSADNGQLVCHLLNDSLKTPLLHVRLLKFDTLTARCTVEKTGAVTMTANENTAFWRLPLPSQEDLSHTMFFLEIYENKRLVDRARWNDGWLANVKLAPAKLSYVRQNSAITVTCHEGLAIGVAFDGDFVLDDNFIDLLPGESRTLVMRPPYGYTAIGDEITPYAYNGTFI